MKHSVFENIQPLEVIIWPFHAPVIMYEGPIAGLSFHISYDDEIWQELDQNTELVLVRDRLNQYDPNAVAIALAGDYDGNPDNFDFSFILGYVPRTSNKKIAELIDEGKENELIVMISQIRYTGQINNRIQIRIYRNYWYD